MATQTKSANGYIDYMQETGERVRGATRKTSEAYLDTAEKTVNTLADLEIRLADASKIDWVSTVAGAHADLTRDLTKMYVANARELLAK